MTLLLQDKFGIMEGTLSGSTKSGLLKTGHSLDFSFLGNKIEIFSSFPPPAVAKSLQSWPTLWDPTDGSPLGSPVPGILQARTQSGLPFPSPMQESEK